MATETLTASISNKSHTYTNAGQYEITIDDALTQITPSYSSNYANTSAITSVKQFGDEITAIGSYAFYNCSKLTSINLANSNVLSIGTYAFRYSGLTGITIPSCLTACTGSYTFSTSALTDISVSPDNQTYSSKVNGTECHALMNKAGTILYAGTTQTTIPNTVTCLTAYAFTNSGINSLSIPSSVKTIGNFCFAYSNLSSMEFPSSITSTTATSLFLSCPNLISAEVPNSVITMTNTFHYDNNLKYVHMSNALTNIVRTVFNGCNNLECLDFSTRTLTSIPTLNTAAGLTALTCDYTVVVPDSLYTTWCAASVWSTISSHIKKASEYPS